MTLIIIDLKVTFSIKDIQHNDTHRNRLNGDTQHKRHSVTTPNIMTVIIIDLNVTLSIKDIQ